MCTNNLLKLLKFKGNNKSLRNGKLKTLKLYVTHVKN